MSTDVHSLTGAFALDALGPEESEEFRRHLEACQVCLDDVRDFRRAAARMGAAEAVQPPPDLKGRVLAAAARTPQMPPRVAEPVGARLARAGRAPARLRWLVAAAAVVAIAGGGVVGIQAVTDDPALAPGAVQVFEAPDARTATVETANGGKVTVGVSSERNEMAVDTRDLPDPGEGRVYQVWSVHDEQMQSAAVLSDPDSGASMELPGEDTEVAITVEPEGGSEQPSGDPIIQVDPRGV